VLARLLRVVTIWGTLLLAFPSVSASLILKEPHERYVSFLKGTDRARHGCRVGNRCRDRRGICARRRPHLRQLRHQSRGAPRETAAVIREAAGDVVLLEADVCSEAAVEAMFAEAKRAFGTPTILVNSAGIDALGKPIAEMSLAEWEAALRTNLTEPFLLRACLHSRPRAGECSGRQDRQHRFRPRGDPEDQQRLPWAEKRRGALRSTSTRSTVANIIAIVNESHASAYGGRSCSRCFATISRMRR